MLAAMGAAVGGGARYAGRPNNAGIGGSHGTGKLPGSGGTPDPGKMPGSGGTPGPGKLPGRIPEGFDSGSASIIGKAKKHWA